MRFIETEILIIGSGAAGLTASVYAGPSGREILVIDKGAAGKSGSTVGAVQISGSGRWSSERDTKEDYFQDVLLSGKGLSDPHLVEALVHDIETVIDHLVAWGMKPEVDSMGEVLVSSTSGHRHPRSISAKKGNSGLAILQTLSRKAKTFPNIKRMSDVITIELVTVQNQVRGAIAYDLAKAEVIFISCNAVILATGGGGQLFPVTSNPVQATGDGFALALKAGAVLVDMEQVQFYPVSLACPEALKGFCMSFYHIAKLLNADHERFMEKYEPEKLEDVTRDRLAYAIACELRSGKGTEQHGVWLDGTSAIEEVKQLFPHEYKLCLEHGVDLAKDFAEIAPAAHFIMGGVMGDENGASSVAGLYVAGETAGGLHGGNRLGNNALSECLVFGARAGTAAANNMKDQPSLTESQLAEIIDMGKVFTGTLSAQSGTYRPYQIKTRIQKIMGQYIGVLRSIEELEMARKAIEEIHQDLKTVTVNGLGLPFAREVVDYIEVVHMVTTAQGIIGSALQRKESRGAHQLIDYPNVSEVVEHTTVQFAKGRLKFGKVLAKNKELVTYVKSQD